MASLYYERLHRRLMAAVAHMTQERYDAVIAAWYRWANR